MKNIKNLLTKYNISSPILIFHFEAGEMQNGGSYYFTTYPTTQPFPNYTGKH